MSHNREDEEEQQEQNKQQQQEEQDEQWCDMRSVPELKTNTGLSLIVIKGIDVKDVEVKI